MSHEREKAVNMDEEEKIADLLKRSADVNLAFDIAIRVALTFIAQDTAPAGEPGQDDKV